MLNRIPKSSLLIPALSSSIRNDSEGNLYFDNAYTGFVNCLAPYATGSYYRLHGFMMRSMTCIPIRNLGSRRQTLLYYLPGMLLGKINTNLVIVIQVMVVYTQLIGLTDSFDNG